ncbi:hemerythrin domain-containing protein [Reichenbachiella sp. MALMAid0571]|uniref:hemerythrin domain-containing protein n=1 Tax=Reichenbachiella sp. MALMAid0571 TaxID=3143939 RepID=UPI0032DFAEB9
MKRTPIKRNEYLKPISREHHQGLLLCWKIRTGFAKNVEVSRIKNYVDWFYQDHLLPHFDLEEKYIFTILEDENELVRKALSDHRRLKRLFESPTDLEKNLSLIEEELESHIRFEERILFNQIQEIASDEQLQSLEAIHNEKGFVDNTEDPFWSKEN